MDLTARRLLAHPPIANDDRAATHVGSVSGRAAAAQPRLRRQTPSAMPRSNPPAWITPQGIDLAKYPIEPVLVQALAPDAKSFRTACVILQSMCHGGRNEAGVFLLGLLQHYRSNFARLEVIAQALAYFPTAAAAQALAAELRGVKGSNASRAYLRAVIRTLQRYPEEIAASLLEDLATDRRVGVRFRQRLKTLVQE